MKEKLSGGRTGIYRDKDKVYRPSNIWTENVHKFLKFLHEEGFDKVPYPYGIDEDGTEKLSFVEGIVHNDLLPEEAKSDEGLISVAELLNEYHKLGNKYLKNLTGEEKWMLQVREPIETMCHGDFAPYNITMNGETAVGVIDFDTLHPGPILWDIAYTLYRWIPFMDDGDEENFGSKEEKFRRLEVFKKAYGISEVNNNEIMNWMIKRLEYLIEFMTTQAEKGNVTFKEHIDNGDLKFYQKDLIKLEQFKM